MTALAIVVVVFTAVLIVVTAGVVGLIYLFYVKPERNEALVISTTKGVQVMFEGAVVFPVIHRAERIALKTMPITLEHRGREGLLCKDNIRVDIRATFYVKVNRTERDIVAVAQDIGTKQASDPKAVEMLFEAKFSEALKTAAKRFTFQELMAERDAMRDRVLSDIGADLGGFVLDDLAIDQLEQTPIEQLNPNNILDAEGIREITRQTAVAAEETRRLELEELKAREQHDAQIEALKKPSWP
ncbi:MAG: SPFH domain-containing protein [Myxococcota bacterium]